MYSYNNFERLFVRYKLEGVPYRVSLSNGVHVSQKNLSYEGLKNLVWKPEDLC